MATPEAAVGASLTLEKLEELHIRKVLEHNPDPSEASAIPGIDQDTLWRKRKKSVSDKIGKKSGWARSAVQRD